MSIEFRVRPVSRFVVTRYESTGSTGNCTAIGEYPNVQSAIMVKQAFERSVGIEGPESDFPIRPFEPSQKKYVVVADGFDVPTMAFYAEGQLHANDVLRFAGEKYGGSWSIFEKV